MPGRRPFDPNIDTEGPEDGAKSGPHRGPNGTKLTIMTLSQILAYEDDPADLILKNGYLEKGSPCVFCGPPGIGKSRLALQLSIKSILGEGFIGWETQADELMWLFLQGENGMKRLKHDLRLMTQSLTKVQLAKIEKRLYIHTLITDTDGHLNLTDLDARKRIIEAIGDLRPDIVVGDPLSAMSGGDLNNDQEMLAVARDFGRIVKKDNPKGAPLLIHHAKPGRNSASGATGFDRGSFARNSKALHGWTRSQVNWAAFNEDDNEKIVVASGKCNNAKEFSPFVIGLNPDTMTYSRTGDSIEEFKERVGGSGQFKQSLNRGMITKLMSKVVPRVREDIKRECIDSKIMADRSFDSYWKQLVEFKEIAKTEDGKWVVT